MRTARPCFTYTATSSGADTVVASALGGASFGGSVTWLEAVTQVSTSAILGRFYAAAGPKDGKFRITSSATPLWNQTFPMINFNPPTGTVPGNTSGVNRNTRPMTNVITDANGTFAGTIVAEGNGFKAGLGTLQAFEAVFTGTLQVQSAGDAVFSITSDDGFIFSIGNGATRVSGPMLNDIGTVPFSGFPVMGAYNIDTPPIAHQIVVHFPGPGVYPYELDYAQTEILPMVLMMSMVAAPGAGVPQTSSIQLSPITVPATPVGQTVTVTAKVADAAGTPQAGVDVALIIGGANPGQSNATTDAAGIATFPLTGVYQGKDTIQAMASVAGAATGSNQVVLTWTPVGSFEDTPVTTGGLEGGLIAFPQSQITLTSSTVIRVATGVTSGTLEYWPASDPAQVHVLNPNVSASINAIIGTFDPTLVPNGEYVIRLIATTTAGLTQAQYIYVRAIGDNKIGRVMTTVTDFTVPLAGIPITIGRTYDSLERFGSRDFGNGWSLAVGGPKLEVNSRGDVSFTIGGRRMTYFLSPVSSGFPFFNVLLPKYVPEAGYFGTLTADGCGLLMASLTGFFCFPDPSTLYKPTLYTYTDPTGVRYVMGADGSLKSITDLSGNTLTFTPNGITSSAGNVNVPFVRDPQGRITLITDPAGKQYQYTYDANGDLIAVDLPQIVPNIEYGYAGHQLISEKDPRGKTAVTEYYADGRLRFLTDAANQLWEYLYDTNNRITTVVNPGFSRSSRDITQTDAIGNVIRREDGFGRKHTYTYDANRNMLTSTDPQGFITRYEYDAKGFRTLLKDPLLNEWKATYNAFGGPTKVTNPEGFSQDVTYDSAFRIATITDSLGQVATFTYTAQGLPATMVDARGNTSRYTYDARGNRTEYFDPLDRKTTTDYDPMGRVIRVIDPRLKETEYEYDDLGRRTLMRDHDGGETRYEYDEAGNKTAEVDARNKRTEFQYDAVNRLEKITYPDTAVRQFTNDFWGHKLTDTDPVGRVTRNDYNLAGELFRVFQAFGTSEQAMTEYTYWPNGWKKTEKDPRGKITSYEYFETGWLKSVRDPLGRVIEYGYNGKGEQESMKDAKLRTTTYGYDARGRQTSINTPDGKSVIRTYDGLGLVLTVKDEENRVTTFEYDAASQLRAVIDALTQRTEYTYDDTGNKLTQKDARTNTTSYEYDNLNRRTKRTLPGGQFETNTYDAVGNMLTRTDFNGRTTTFQYDPLNRLERKTPDPVFVALPIEFTYFADGLRKSMIDVSGTSNYTYTGRAQLKTKATPQGTLTYTYDLGGNVTKAVSSNANGTNVSYAWDDANQLDSVTDNFTGATTAVDFDETGNLKTTLYANGVLHTFGYDIRDRVSNLAVTKGGVLASYAYTHYDTGRQKDVTEDSGRKSSYTYDALYRLLNEDITGAGANNGALNYGLDPVGNRLSLLSTLAVLPSQAFTYDTNDRISGDTFDANGNTTTSNGHSYFYDFEDRLTFQDSSVQNVYDGDGNRVARIEGGTMVRYLIDDLNPTGWAQVAEETSGGLVIAQYTHGPMRISQRRPAGGTWQVRHYGYDGGGSVRQLFNDAGTLTDTYDYDAFAKPSSIRDRPSTSTNTAGNSSMRRSVCTI